MGVYGPDLSYQGQFGWRLPTLAELANAPLATDFLFSGANVPLGGNDPVSGAEFYQMDATLTGNAACAAPYFSIVQMCDWGNGPGKLAAPMSWWQAGALWSAEALVVRTASVPLPASGVLLASVLGFLGWMGRRKRAPMA